jgi:hypothetical protein
MSMVGAVSSLRDEVAATQLTLDAPGAATGRATRETLLHQLDDYVLPRLRSLDAPLLAVVGGSTGAGKSTLVNSIVDSEVSRSGVLRPTTTTPVLVHHPEDEHWFLDDRVLPGLSRVTGAPSPADGSDALRLVSSRSLPPGMALLDAPDIDSVVSANRALAGQLLSAADLWLFVTTAARYADAVPWDLLRQASERGTAVAIVLDRVPPEAMADIRSHLATMLREQGLSTAPIFAVPEARLTAEGRLPESDVSRLRSWLTALASDARARAVVIRQTLEGALASLDDRAAVLVSATRQQAAAATELRDAVEVAYRDALKGVEDGVTDGTLLRGEVLARWQEYVGTGEFFKQVESTVSRVRDRITAAFKGTPPPTGDLGEALQSGVADLIAAQAHGAASTAARRGRRGGGAGASCRAVTACSPATRRSRRRPPISTPRSPAWSATGRASCSTWSATRARTDAPQPASLPMASTGSASSSCSSSSPTPAACSPVPRSASPGARPSSPRRSSRPSSVTRRCARWRPRPAAGSSSVCRSCTTRSRAGTTRPLRP